MKMRKRIALCLLAVMITVMSVSPAMAGEWKVGNNGRWWFLNSDGSYPKSGMYNIGEQSFIFDGAGYLLESQWTKLSDGNWYYCLPGGYVARNQWVGDYYVGWNGAMVTNTWVGDYFVGADGKWNPNAKK
jgi:glucan-binding YG repeat protein